MFCKKNAQNMMRFSRKICTKVRKKIIYFKRNYLLRQVVILKSLDIYTFADWQFIPKFDILMFFFIFKILRDCNISFLSISYVGTFLFYDQFWSINSSLFLQGTEDELKELSLCNKLWFYNTYFFSTWWCKPLIFQT